MFIAIGSELNTRIKSLQSRKRYTITARPAYTHGAPTAKCKGEPPNSAIHTSPGRTFYHIPSPQKPQNALSTPSCMASHRSTQRRKQPARTDVKFQNLSQQVVRAPRLQNDNHVKAFEQHGLLKECLFPKTFVVVCECPGIPHTQTPRPAIKQGTQIFNPLLPSSGVSNLKTETPLMAWIPSVEKVLPVNLKSA